MGKDRDDGIGVSTLLRELADGGQQLVRREMQLARLEVRDVVVGAGVGAALVSSGAVFALLGVLSLVAGLILFVGDKWLDDRYWLAALIAFVIAAAAATILARRGAQRLAPSELVPDQTLATLEEDKEWLKRRLT